MKANELMIGDWVCTKLQVDDTGTEPVFEKIPQKVVELTEGVNGIYVKCTSTFDGAEIEPILLSEEILEENGFMKTDFLDYGGNRIGISLLYKSRSNGEEGFRVLIENRNPRIETRTTICPVKYVHEVQHILRVLEIDKEIIL